LAGGIGTDDYWVIRGSQTSKNEGYLELATGDDGNEPIYVCQYSKAGGAGDYVNVLGAEARRASLLDASGNTSFPGHLTAASMETGTLKCTTINLITT
jgi:hypothetical protein